MPSSSKPSPSHSSTGVARAVNSLREEIGRIQAAVRALREAVAAGRGDGAAR